MLISKIFALILFASLTHLVAQEKEVDVMPEIIGGMKALGKNVVYPEEAKKAQITGKVFIKAVIDVEGNVKEASIIEGVHELLNKAAVDAVKKLAGVNKARVIEYRKPFTFASLLAYESDAKNLLKIDKTMLYEMATPDIMYMWSGY